MLTKFLKILNTFTVKQRGNVLDLNILVTTNCNLNCDYCYLRGRSSGKLTLADYSIIAKSLAPLNSVTLSGGEPFLFDDLGSLIRLFVRVCSVHKFNILTNGTFPDKIKSLNKDLQNLNVRIRYYVSYKDEMHLKDREYNKKISSSINDIKKNSFTELNWLYLIREASSNKLERMAWLKSTYGGMVVPVFERNADGSTNSLIKLSDLKLALKWKLITRREYCLSKIKNRINLIGNNNPCLAGITNLTMFPNGDVHFCELTPPVFNIKNWNGNLKESLRNFTFDTSICRKCALDCQKEIDYSYNIWRRLVCLFQ